jgi:hypothetical protein
MLINLKYPACWIKGIFIFVFSPFFPKDEYYNAYRFIGRHGITPYPFDASMKYNKLPVTVFYDEDFPYVEHNGKKLFFPNHLTPRRIRNIYRSLVTEQDPESAHRYVQSFDELKDKILLDIGAAEGIFALDTIEFVKGVYLFECEEQWQNPLNKTFEPWKEKVNIVNKYIGDKNTEECLTLDTFIKGKAIDKIHIKMDIEGAELSALQGAKELLSNGKCISFSVCTYHKEEDERVIKSHFEKLGFVCALTSGYLFNMSQMRRAICRGKNY